MPSSQTRGILESNNMRYACYLQNDECMLDYLIYLLNVVCLKAED